MAYVKIAIGLFAPLALTACGPQATDVSGDIRVPSAAVNLEDSAADEPGDTCFFSEEPGSSVPSGYPDISVGAQAKLLGPNGAIVSVSSLQRGSLLFGWRESAASYFSSSETFKEDLCVYEFTFEEVTLEEDFYSVEVANRGQVTYPAEELLDGVSLSLGG